MSSATSKPSSAPPIFAIIVALFIGVGGHLAYTKYTEPSAAELAAAEQQILDEGHAAGLEEGKLAGYEEGHEVGLEEGHAAGLQEAREEQEDEQSYEDAVEDFALYPESASLMGMEIPLPSYGTGKATINTYICSVNDTVPSRVMLITAAGNLAVRSEDKLPTDLNPDQHYKLTTDDVGMVVGLEATEPTDDSSEKCEPQESDSEKPDTEGSSEKPARELPASEDDTSEKRELPAGEDDASQKSQLDSNGTSN